jgi:hypothetical protein
MYTFATGSTSILWVKFDPIGTLKVKDIPITTQYGLFTLTLLSVHIYNLPAVTCIIHVITRHPIKSVKDKTVCENISEISEIQNNRYSLSPPQML